MHVLVSEKNMASLDDEYSWSPPSEAELKVIEARRERNNKISSLIGQYLLKGYKMLATTCPVCECVLLEDRMKNKYCVGCSEVDADTRKDNPAVSEEAARRAVQEIQHRQNQDKESSPILTPLSNQNIRVATTQSEPTALLSVATSTSESPPAQATKSVKSLSIHGVDLHEDVTQAVDALREKLTWASKQLNATTSIHEAQTLAVLISDTCRAISALRDL
ncbi:protein ZNRD2 isoform X3 [Penaeus vannamei]|uniref:protein ZNRD2 isoform X3 n=1 Tax=Penaeus vannamei TaxID=6689 RepID=UPI00387F406E